MLDCNSLRPNIYCYAPFVLEHSNSACFVSLPEEFNVHFVIRGFRRALLGCYAACNGNYLPTFRDNISVPSSRVKEFKKKNMGKSSRNVGKEITTIRCVIYQTTADLRFSFLHSKN
jgi:hypothetical protein